MEPSLKEEIIPFGNIKNQVKRPQVAMNDSTNKNQPKLPYRSIFKKPLNSTLPRSSHHSESNFKDNDSKSYETSESIRSLKSSSSSQKRSLMLSVVDDTASQTSLESIADISCSVSSMNFQGDNNKENAQNMNESWNQHMNVSMNKLSEFDHLKNEILSIQRTIMSNTATKSKDKPQHIQSFRKMAQEAINISQTYQNKMISWLFTLQYTPFICIICEMIIEMFKNINQSGEECHDKDNIINIANTCLMCNTGIFKLSQDVSRFKTCTSGPLQLLQILVQKVPVPNIVNCIVSLGQIHNPNSMVQCLKLLRVLFNEDNGLSQIQMESEIFTDFIGEALRSNHGDIIKEVKRFQKLIEQKSPVLLEIINSKRNKSNNVKVEKQAVVNEVSVSLESFNSTVPSISSSVSKMSFNNNISETAPVPTAINLNATEDADTKITSSISDHCTTNDTCYAVPVPMKCCKRVEEDDELMKKFTPRPEETTMSALPTIAFGVSPDISPLKSLNDIEDDIAVPFQTMKSNLNEIRDKYFTPINTNRKTILQASPNTQIQFITKQLSQANKISLLHRENVQISNESVSNDINNIPLLPVSANLNFFNENVEKVLVQNMDSKNQLLCLLEDKEVQRKLQSLKNTINLDEEHAHQDLKKQPARFGWLNVAFSVVFFGCLIVWCICIVKDLNNHIDYVMDNVSSESNNSPIRIVDETHAVISLSNSSISSSNEFFISEAIKEEKMVTIVEQEVSKNKTIFKFNFRLKLTTQTLNYNFLANADNFQAKWMPLKFSYNHFSNKFIKNVDVVHNAGHAVPTINHSYFLVSNELKETHSNITQANSVNIAEELLNLPSPYQNQAFFKNSHKFSVRIKFNFVHNTAWLDLISTTDYEPSNVESNVAGSGGNATNEDNFIDDIIANIVESETNFELISTIGIVENIKMNESDFVMRAATLNLDEGRIVHETRTEIPTETVEEVNVEQKNVDKALQNEVKDSTLSKELQKNIIMFSPSLIAMLVVLVVFYCIRFS